MKTLFDKIFGGRVESTGKDLEAYLDGEADAETRRRVEAAATDSPLWSDALDGWKAAGPELRPKDVPDFKRLQARRPSRNSLRPMVNRVAALLLGALLLSGLYLYWQDRAPERLALEYSDAFQDDRLATQRALSDNSAPHWSEAVSAMAEEDMEAAIFHWRKYLEKKPGDRQARMHLGYCHAQQRNNEAAISYLTPLAEAEGAYQTEAEWYLALALLKKGQTADAARYLQRLVDKADLDENSRHYAQKAEKILEALY